MIVSKLRRPSRRSSLLLASLVAGMVPGIAGAAGIQNQEPVQVFIQEMATKHQFDPDVLGGWFGQVSIDEDIIAAISKPAERTLEWKDYSQIFLKPERIEAGKLFLKEQAETLARAEETYGVPASVVAAIIGVETFYGRWKGKHSVMTALSTLAFGYPRRSEFFRKELEHYLLLAREQGFDPMSLNGSYAGAMGYGQFIPSSYRHYAVDFDGNGQADLFGSQADAIGSVANYLARHGWQRGQGIAWPVEPETEPADALLPKSQKPANQLADFARLKIDTRGLAADTSARLMRFEGQDGTEYWVGLANFYAITRYNHSDLYALAVFQLSQAIAAP